MMAVLVHDKKNRAGIGFVLIPKMGSFVRVQVDPSLLAQYLVEINGEMESLDQNT